MKWGKNVIVENHWGTKLKILGHTRIIYSNINNSSVSVWELKVLESGEPKKVKGTTVVMSETLLIQEGYKPLKKYDTPLWKVLNGDN